MPAVRAMSEKITLCRLWERTSRNGNLYLSGFVGLASVVCFRSTADPLPEGCDAIWTMYVAPGREQPPKNRDEPRTMGPRGRVGRPSPAVPGSPTALQPDDMGDRDWLDRNRR